MVPFLTKQKKGLILKSMLLFTSVERELQRMIKQMEKDKKSETELNQETKNNDEL